MENCYFRVFSQFSQKIDFSKCNKIFETKNGYEIYTDPYSERLNPLKPLKKVPVTCEKSQFEILKFLKIKAQKVSCCCD